MKFKFKDIFDLQIGKTPSRSNPEYWENGQYTWISIADLTKCKGKIISNSKEKISQYAVDYSGIKPVYNGTIIMSFKLSIGKVAIVETEMGKAYTNEAIMSFDIRSDNSQIREIAYMPKNYLYYLLQSINWNNINGSNRAVMGITLNKKTLEEIEINIPPLETQHHIADVLDKVTAQIDNCNKILQNLDLLVKSKFVQMFGDPVSNPMGWEENKLSNECEIITGNTPSRKIKEYYGNYIEWIKSDNINTSLSFLTTATEYLSQKGLKVARYVEKGSILMTCIAGSINCIGNVAITDRTVSFNQQINAIVPNKNNSWFMYYQFILSKKYIQSCINMSLKGILTKNQLSNLEFIFPPIELQNQFAEFVENVEKQKTTTQNTLNQLETLKNALMQEYFS